MRCQTGPARCSSVDAHAGQRARAGHDDADRAAGRGVGLGRQEAHDAQRRRALHRADVGELQAGRVVARDRERDAAAAQRGDRHAHGAPAPCPRSPCRASARPRSARRVGRSPAMPRIQTLTVAASRGNAEEPGAQLERPGAGRQQGARRDARGAARGAAHERMPAATCSLSPTRARSTASWRAHHGIEHEPHVLPGQARGVERERVPARRRAEVAEHVRRAVGRAAP